MTDIELNNLVAQKVFGWPAPVFIANEGHDPKQPIYAWLKCLRAHSDDDFGSCEHSWTLGDKYFYRAPNFSGDIKDAWLVIERLKDLTFYNGSKWSTRQPWQCFCSQLADCGGDSDAFVHAFWYITPKSICTAALVAMGAEVKL